MAINLKYLLFLLSFLILPFVSIEAQNRDLSNFPEILPSNIDHLTELSVFTPSNGVAKNGVQFIDGQTILFASRDGKVRSWKAVDFPSREIINIGFPSSAVFDATGRIVVCQCSDTSPNQDAKLFDLASGNASMVASKFGMMTDLVLDSQGTQLAIAGGWTRDVSRVEVWDLSHFSKTLTVSSGSFVFSTAFSSSDNHMLAVGFENSIELWNIETEQKIFTFEQNLPMNTMYGFLLYVGDIAFNSRGTVLASMSREGFVWLWNVEKGEEINLLRDDSIHVDQCGCYSLSDAKLAFSPNGMLLAAGDGAELRLWDVETRRIVRVINQSIVDLAFNNTGTLLITVDRQGSIKFWSIGAKSIN